MTVTLGETTALKARVKNGEEWSAIHEALFYVPQDFAKLRITEIMYHPPAAASTDGDEYEFVELKNVGEVVLDLSGVQFSDGISYAFPFGTQLPPEDFLVLVANSGKFEERYAGVEWFDVYDRNLSNSGEALTLSDFSGETLATVTYDDSAPWPEEPDGSGYSLVPLSATPVGDQNDPAMWRRSLAIGGSPGTDDGAATPGAPHVEREPRDLTVFEGERAVFTIFATGFPLPSYQWYGDGLEIAGATEWLFATPPATPGDDGKRLYCVVTNQEGTSESREVTLRVRAWPVFDETVATPTIRPNGGVLKAGTPVILNTTTAGAEIRYTLDGSAPSVSATLYVRPFTLPAGFESRVMARGFRPGFNESDVASARFTVVPDTTSPTIESVSAAGKDTVKVIFSEPVDENSAEDLANYAFNGNLGEIAVLSAVLGADLRTVLLTTAPLRDGVTYTLSVTGVEDLAAIPNMVDDSATFTYSNDLVGYWQFDDGAGLDASDSSSMGHHGQLRNGPQWITDTPDGSSYALRFDGNDDSVDIGPVDVEGNALTITAWFKAASFQVSDARLISKAKGTANEDHYWMLSTISSGGALRLRFRLRASGNTSLLIASSGDLSPDVWIHAAAVYDGSAMRLYKDGEEVGSLAKSGMLDVDAGVWAAIGNQPPVAGDRPFDGAIDDVRLYRRALSALEIAELVSAVRNSQPEAEDDTYRVDEDDTLIVDAANGVLANDTDPDAGDTLAVLLVSNVSHGVLRLDEDGSFTFTPEADYEATDSFQYRATDGREPSNTATVRIIFEPRDDAPVALDDQAFTVENTPVVIHVLANDKICG